MACRECHMAKVKCDKVIPCSRCLRLSKICIRHESRQGQGKSGGGSKSGTLTTTSSASQDGGSTSNRKRVRRTNSTLSDGTSTTTTTATDNNNPTTTEKVSEDATLSAEIQALQANHFGLRYLLRSFLAIAFRRRNFGLLARAGMVAHQSGIRLDDILCESPEFRGMDFLYPILLVPAAEQTVLGKGRLSWSEIPMELLEATGCVGASDEQQGNDDDDVVAHRWIWIREVHKGVSRYLTTPAFERDVCTWQQIQDTYQANEKSVIELFLPESEHGKHPKALAHQVSLHGTYDPHRKLQASRMRSKLRLKGGAAAAAAATGVGSSNNSSSDTTIESVDQIMCMCILNMDHDLTLVEYASCREHKKQQQQQRRQQQQQQQNMEERNVDAPPHQAAGADADFPPDDFEPWLDLDECSDIGDLDCFLELIM